MRTQETFKLCKAILFEDRTQPWRDLDFSCPVPSMMIPDEFSFLHYLISRHYEAAGVIVDMGPLAGGSTYSLASALPPEKGHIFSYDLWHFFPDWQRFFPGRELHPGDDLLSLFWQHVAPFQERISAQKGDLSQYRWHGDPIEVIFIDAAKSPRAMRHIVNEFFPSLIPGAYVLHQDYVSSECPWIHIVMDVLRNHFECYDSPEGGTICMRLRDKIPAGILTEDYFESMPVEEARAHLAGARGVLVNWYSLCVWLAEATYLAMKGRPDEADATLRQVVAHPWFATHVQPDVGMVERQIEDARNRLADRQLRSVRENS